MLVELAGSHLVVVPGHFLHSPGNFQLYDPVSKILFTGSLGSSNALHSGNIDTEEDFNSYLPLMTVSHSRHIAGNGTCRQWAAMVRQLDVEMIVPQAGACITGKNLVEKFYQWVEGEKTAVDDFANGLFRLPVVSPDLSGRKGHKSTGSLLRWGFLIPGLYLSLFQQVVSLGNLWGSMIPGWDVVVVGDAVINKISCIGIVRISLGNGT